MPVYELAGDQRRKLRFAIKNGFDSGSLTQAMVEADFDRDDFSDDPVFNNRIFSIIDACFDKGQLIRFCDALASVSSNQAVRSDILAVKQWLLDQEAANDPDAMQDTAIAPSSDDLSAATPGAVVILGESKSTSTPEATLACDELARELGNRNVPYERWSDRWLGTTRSADALTNRPIFVRTFLDPSKSNVPLAAEHLLKELEVAFGDENIPALTDCSKVLWRPQGPEWTPPATGPLLYSSIDRPADFGGWLAKLLSGTSSGGAMVYFEDPAATDDMENKPRRDAVYKSLVSALTNNEPPLDPDCVAIGPDRFVKVVTRRHSLTVIAAHDLGTLPDSREAAIARFKGIDERIRDTLREKRIENAPLMCVGVLLRNAHEFEAEVEFSRKSTIRHWGMLKLSKDADGAYKPDMHDVGRLRERAADLTRERRVQ